MRAYTREELLALTPGRYLANGFFDDAGEMRPALLGEYATAAANQLAEAELSPQELAFTAEALALALPLHGAFADALEEALEVVERLIRQPNNPGLVRWLRDCAAGVADADDAAALLEHVEAVRRQYALIAAFAGMDETEMDDPAGRGTAQ